MNTGGGLVSLERQKIRPLHRGGCLLSSGEMVVVGEYQPLPFF